MGIYRNDRRLYPARDEILHHAFVLGPLAEVAAQERHSTSGRCYGELWRAFEKSAPPLRPIAFEF